MLHELTISDEDGVEVEHMMMCEQCHEDFHAVQDRSGIKKLPTDAELEAIFAAEDLIARDYDLQCDEYLEQEEAFASGLSTVVASAAVSGANTPNGLARPNHAFSTLENAAAALVRQRSNEISPGSPLKKARTPSPVSEEVTTLPDDFDEFGMYTCPDCGHYYDGNAQCSCSWAGW